MSRFTITKFLKVTFVLFAVSISGCADLQLRKQNELVIVAKMKWTRLVPTDNILVINEDNDDGAKITISNSCGIEETMFEVNEVIRGPQVEEVEVSNVLGEWCTPNYGVSRELFLIYAIRKNEKWHVEFGEELIESDDGSSVILPEFSREIGDLNLDTIRRHVNVEVIYADLDEVSEGRLKVLLREGYVHIKGREVLFKTGIYLSDLKRKLVSNLAN